MKIIRPIRPGDYAALYQIANDSGIGFTSLPINEELLRSKIARAQTAFAKEVNEPGSESYLFVMEDSDSGEVVGTSGIEGAVGLDDAFYHYHLGTVVHASRELKVHNSVDILTLCNDYTGVSELCTLFLQEHARGDNNGRTLSKFRFLFMQEHAHRFAETVIAEMRGISGEDGRSPFWEWLEEHFFSMDFPTADYLTGIGQKVFIAELMPKYPIYVNLLSKEAQAVIGKVHDKTRPALQLLESEGFSCRGYVDIFDAGPTVEANINHIKTIQQSKRLQVKIGRPEDGEPMIMINTQVENFRGVCQPLELADDGSTAIIDAATARALEVTEGDAIRVAPVK